MIKASELRIGNAIWDETRKQIKWVTHRVISDLASHPSPLPYSPIALTVEWMARLGFEWNATDERYYIQIGNTLYLEFDIDFDCFITPESWGGSCPWSAIKHIHQLQNIYFALTGQELEIKL